MYVGTNFSERCASHLFAQRIRLRKDKLIEPKLSDLFELKSGSMYCLPNLNSQASLANAK